MNPIRIRRHGRVAVLLAGVFAIADGWACAANGTDSRVVRRTIIAEVVAIDQCYFYNRLGAYAPDGMIYALKRDIVPKDKPDGALVPGNVRLRADKRPRPLVLRVNVGDVLEVHFTNLLQESPPGGGAQTRYAGLSAFGLELIDVVDANRKITEPGKEHSGSFVGKNSTSLAPPAKPGETLVYRFYAPAEGTFLMTSYADTTGPQSSSGLFGAVNVQPVGAEYYRSQVTREDLRAATVRVETRPDRTLAIRGEEFVKLSEMRTDDEKLLQGNAEARIESVKPRYAQRAVGSRKLTLNRVDPSRRTTNTAPVELTADNRLLGETGHPLINYLATFETGKPVLKMIEAETGKNPLFAFGPGEVPRAAVDLSAGIISTPLREQFQSHNARLSDQASVTKAALAKLDHGAWLITDSNSKAYVVRQPEQQPDSFQVYAATFKVVYGDLTAVITGPDAGRFPTTNTSPSFRPNPSLPDRRQPYREYTILYHQMSPAAVQAFPEFSASFVSGYLQNTLAPGKDEFGINYGIAGISAEVLANRIGVGPMGRDDAVDLKYEEFFLSAWAVGDPAMVVNRPANTSPKLKELKAPVGSGQARLASSTDNRTLLRSAQRTGQMVRGPGRYIAPAEPTARALSSKVEDVRNLYPDDPSNVYHSYMRDHVKFRILHAGAGPSHVHHLHAHQWLRSPNSDDSTYLDSQLIIPGVAYTLEIAYGGSGNRNLTVGDSIFHCHFYPHFAAGMWSLWRVHDVFEDGTELDAGGNCKKDARALPDGEIARGTPIPAIVPLPTLGMAPLPAKVKLIDDGRRVEVEPARTAGGDVQLNQDGEPVYDRNPGYPFFIPGYSGHRAPHPPLDFAWKEREDKPGEPLLDKDNKKQYLDGGLPRHLVLGGDIVRQFATRWDFTKDFILYDSEDKEKSDRTAIAGGLKAFQLPEDGTAVEKVAMATHAQRTHKTILPNGFAGNFTLNGLPPVSGAPFAAPDVSDDGSSNKTTTRRYKAAALQMDVVQTKKGWHYPQQRFLTLWGDIRETVAGVRPPQPFFFRSNTGDTIEFWHTNLVPSYYELDDFQVRTPTDILGQHIHLVKFDVTASDGAGNGFNYEDGTFSPDEVRERIDAIKLKGGLYAFDKKTQFYDEHKQLPLCVKPYDVWYDDILGPEPAGQNWNGAQTTIQRWDTDPLLNDNGVDRTLRTVFTHDHFGPSTHQQVGLYAGMLIEPENSTWYLPDGQRMNTRFDGGPTSWNGYIVPEKESTSYREFALEFADSQLAYDKDSTIKPTSPYFDWFDLTGIKPEDLKPGRLPDGNQLPSVRVQFAAQGLVLTPDASVAVVEANKSWTITENMAPNPTDDAHREIFRVRAVVDTNNQTVLKVSAPSALFNVAPNKYAEVKAELKTAGKLPHGSQVRTQFTNAGITLPDEAILAVVLSNEAWTITCPGQKEIYRIRNNFVGLGYDYTDANGNTQHIDAVLLVYTPTLAPGWEDPNHSLNPSTDALNGPVFFNKRNGPPYPLIVISGRQGAMALNYRSEPVPLRLAAGNDPKLNSNDLAFAYSSNVPRNDPDLETQPAAFAMNLGLKSQLHNGPVAPEIQAEFLDKSGVNLPTSATVAVGSSGKEWRIVSTAQGGTVTTYVIKELELSPKAEKKGSQLYVFTKVPGSDRLFPPPVVPLSALPEDGGVTGRDPFTPMLRAYANDKVQIRTLVGAHLTPHSFQMSGIKWSTEASDPNSGYRNAQIMGLSEHFEMLFTVPPTTSPPPTTTNEEKARPFADYWYAPSSDPTGQANGLWGLMRAYDRLNVSKGAPTYLEPLPSNRAAGKSAITLNFEEMFEAAEKAKRPTRTFDITAIAGSTCLANGSLSYNDRANAQISDPNAIILVRTNELIIGQNNKWQLTTKGPVEPVILRAAAGDWIKLILRNAVDARSGAITNPVTGWGYLGLAPLFNNLSLFASSHVGLHPSLVAYDVKHGDGMNIGYNPTQTLKANFPQQVEIRTVYLYAGNLELKQTWDGKQEVKETPVEFGAINLVPAEPMVQHQRGLYGGLIIEPEGSRWIDDPNTRASAVVTKSDGSSFRDLVILWQNDVENFALSTQGAVNYRAEPFGGRGIPQPGSKGFEAAFSNTIINSTDPAKGDPQTPIFHGPARMPTRFRMLFPGGSSDNTAVPPAILVLQAHDWQDEPYTDKGRKIGDNRLSQHVGSQEHSSYEALNLVLPSAGGTFGVAGDYLYHSYMAEGSNGTWGLFRVQADTVVIAGAKVDSQNLLSVDGYNNPNPDGKFAPSVDIFSVELDADRNIKPTTKTTLATVAVDQTTGRWRLDPSSKQVTLTKTALIYAESTPGFGPAQPGFRPVRVQVH